MNSDQIISTNNARKEEMFGEYDPLIGTGSQISRRKLYLNDRQYILLPESAFSEPYVQYIEKSGSLEKLAESDNTYTIDHLNKSLIDIRHKHDFEFWAVTCVKVQDKLKKKMVPFMLRYPQRRLLKELERMRLSGKPIRLVLLKARQWGGSTLVQVYMAWIQMHHRTRWHSAVVAEDEGQARNIRGMFTNLAKMYPNDIGSITFKPYEGSTKNRMIVERDCVVGIGSAQKPDNLRSYDFAMLHLSEVGIWKETAGKKPEDLVQSVRATVAREPYTMIVLESTAKGSGNFFHREWISAERGESGYCPLFVPWFEIDLYRIPFETTDEMLSFIESLSDYEQHLWELGATLEGIHWYRIYKEGENYTDWRMKEEFPSTAEEAFQSTGRRYFRAQHVHKFRKLTTKPVAIGDLYADGVKGKEAFQNIVFDEKRDGELHIWKFPHEPAPEVDEVITNRYCAFADIGGKTAKADYSVVTIIDRYWMLYGGVAERVATWRGHMDQDLFAWKAAQLAQFYDTALLAIERNSLRSKSESTDGSHHLTILDEIKDHYDNLFARNSPDKVKQGFPLKYGFFTGAGTKELILNSLVAAIRDDLYYENDVRAVDEMDYFEIKDDGTLGAKEGQNDDIVITTSGCVWLSNNFMDPPQLIKKASAKEVEILRKRHQNIQGNHAVL